MKFLLKLSKDEESSVTVVCAKVTPTIKKIEELCNNEDGNEVFYAYDGNEAILINIKEVNCFFTRDNKVYVSVEEGDYATKYRIKQIVEIVDDSFIKINQGCVVKVDQIQKFIVSFGGALKVTLKNGFTDYVSRRETTNIKRRLGI